MYVFGFPETVQYRLSPKALNLCCMGQQEQFFPREATHYKAERSGINGQFIVTQKLTADSCRDICLALGNHFEKVR